MTKVRQRRRFGSASLSRRQLRDNAAGTSGTRPLESGRRTMARPTTPETLPPHARLIEMAFDYFRSKLLFTATRLDVAGLLAEGPTTSAELARALRLHERSTYRFMRALAGIGIVSETDEATFALTPLGEALRPDAPVPMRAPVLSIAGDLMSRSLDELLYSLETGEPSFDRIFGMGFFEYLASNPKEAKLFNESMVNLSSVEPPAVAAAYDFSLFGSIVDVGGSTGRMLVQILQRYDRTRGVLLDLPHVLEEAIPFVQRHGLQDRIDIVPGDFFVSIPAGHDAYILSHVIHDWPEEQALRILRNCREAIDRNGTLLIVETVLAPENAPHLGMLYDISMLVAFGGQERTQQEYAELLDRAGFRLERVVPTETAVSIVVAAPA